MELDEGAISVDGLNIAKLGLAQLRNAMAIIPQVCTMSITTQRQFEQCQVWRGNAVAVISRTSLQEYTKNSQC